jgi:hypothetical protein
VSQDTTVVYYTCNRDYPVLEEAVRKTIREHSGDLPIVSVSHSPIEFGHNITVGLIEPSPEHVFVQLRLAAQIAKSRFLAVCEADTLYPPKFFQFQPSRDDTYYYPNDGYVTWHSRSLYFIKRMRELTGIVARDHLLRILDVMQKQCAVVDRALLSGQDAILRIDKITARQGKVEFVDLGPVVTLKTDRGMHSTSPHNRANKHELPVWGFTRDMWKRYTEGN